MRRYLFAIAVLGVILLTGCSFNATTEDKLSKVLGDMHKTENTYQESQKELHDLEQTEQKLFNETMALTQEDTEQLEKNVAELQELLEERKEKIKNEEEAMVNAKELVSDFDKIEEKLEDNEQQKIEELKESVEERYKAHADFIEEYQELTNMQQDLYEMLGNDETDVSALNNQVESINKQNEAVVSAIQSFNDLTIALNETRDEVYDFFNQE